MAYNLALNEGEKIAGPSLKLHNSIQVLNNYQKNLGKELRSKDTKIRHELKEKKESSNKFKKQFLKDAIKDIPKKIKPVEKEKTVQEKSYDKEANCKDCRRILNMLRELGPQNIKELVECIGRNKDVVISALRFLTAEDIKLVQEKLVSGNYIYEIGVKNG